MFVCACICALMGRGGECKAASEKTKKGFTTALQDRGDCELHSSAASRLHVHAALPYCLESQGSNGGMGNE
eukprot:1157362-Pelagomonas_calceolata.AAC.10